MWVLEKLLYKRLGWLEILSKDPSEAKPVVVVILVVVHQGIAVYILWRLCNSRLFLQLIQGYFDNGIP